ncbi:MAG: copper-translocating P-type ATPase [Candidatus Wolfebacteria bacterium]|nr:copper-translocating P-type ATPase [Candidatus Wolfebacteria bacterium]
MALVKARNPNPPAGGETRKDDGMGKHKSHGNVFLKKFWVTAVLTVPILIYAEAIQGFFKFTPPEFQGKEYLSLVLGTIVFFYAGSVFLTSAWREIKGKSPGMMTLIALAISVAYVWSVVATFTGEMPLFWELATLIAIMLLGHWLEAKSVSIAQGALKELAKLLPDTAEVIRNGKKEEVRLEELKKGDNIFVRPGGRIPADGKVIEGISETDESMITGESKPVTKEKGSEVIGGTINGDGALTIEVTRIGDDTFLSGVMRLVEEAQGSKSKLQKLSDRAAFYLTIVAISAGLITFFAWTIIAGNPIEAIRRLVAVMVIACPHALGLAIPLVAVISTAKAAKNGFLIKNRIAFEAARKVDTVLFDKTGTLTKGEYGVQTIISNSPALPAGRQFLISNDDILRLAAAVDAHSEHPIAKAMVKEAEARSISLPEVRNFIRVPGKGAKGEVEGKTVWVGGERIIEEAGGEIPEELKTKGEEYRKKGHTIIYVLKSRELVGAIALADVIREESKEAVQALHKAGISVAMVTGDSEDVAKWVAEELEIDSYFANVLPEEKIEKVKLLQKEGKKVAMVGDGINDAPALMQANVGIAIGAGTNVAIESAGIILMRSNPKDIAKLITLSKLTFSKMIQNLFWAAGYNVVAIPLAGGALASYGIVLEPAVAAIFMSASTVIVAINALLLKRRKI